MFSKMHTCNYNHRMSYCVLLLLSNIVHYCLENIVEKEYIFQIFANIITLSLRVCIRRFSGPNVPAFGLNTERYGVSLRIQSECGKIRTIKTANTDTSHAVFGGVFVLSLRPAEAEILKHKRTEMLSCWVLKKFFKASEIHGILPWSRQ